MWCGNCLKCIWGSLPVFKLTYCSIKAINWLTHNHTWVRTITPTIVPPKVGWWQSKFTRSALMCVYLMHSCQYPLSLTFWRKDVLVQPCHLCKPYHTYMLLTHYLRVLQGSEVVQVHSCRTVKYDFRILSGDKYHTTILARDYCQWIWYHLQAGCKAYGWSKVHRPPSHVILWQSGLQTFDHPCASGVDVFSQLMLF